MLYLFFIHSLWQLLEGTSRGILFAFLIAVPRGTLYNEWTIREGPMEQGPG
jgi:hypothetical protein